MRRLTGDRGSAALFVAIFAPAMIFLAGLVIDGGAAIEARQRAADIAEQAARAAAGQCDVAVLRSRGVCRVTSQAEARSAAAPFLADNGVTASSVVRTRPDGPNQYQGVEVSVTITFETTLLGIAPSFDTLTIEESAEAIAVTGL